MQDHNQRTLLFSANDRDGLTYIDPLPIHHPVYKTRAAVAAIGRAIDRILFFPAGGSREDAHCTR
jgi:hypothetical protein